MSGNAKKKLSVVDGETDASGLPTNREIELELWKLCNHEDPAIAVHALDVMVKWQAFKKGFSPSF
ncbi:MAG: hypothetical protein F6K36_29140 [Symploca sp. SIO3C6]|nr:hypothetical protein [Symploca sp. SIO3C6]